MRYRTAFLGLLFGGIFLVAFAMRGGMAPQMAVLFYAAHFAIAIALTRIRAEIGLPVPSNDRNWSASQRCQPARRTANRRTKSDLVCALLLVQSG